MHEPLVAHGLFEQVFTRILNEQMAGLPLLNPALQVECLGFREHQGRVLGMLVTPWLMTLVLLPGPDDDWSDLELGHKQPHVFPAGTRKLMVNEVEGIGRYQALSVYSPMYEFNSQGHALAAAEAFLHTLMTPAVADVADPVDEELLGRIMRGEEPPDPSPVDRSLQDSPAAPSPAGKSGRLADIGVRVEQTSLTRRQLLRGLLPQ